MRRKPHPRRLTAPFNIQKGKSLQTARTREYEGEKSRRKEIGGGATPLSVCWPEEKILLLLDGRKLQEYPEKKKGKLSCPLPATNQEEGTGKTPTAEAEKRYKKAKEEEDKKETSILFILLCWNAGGRQSFLELIDRKSSWRSCGRLLHGDYRQKRDEEDRTLSPARKGKK